MNSYVRLTFHCDSDSDGLFVFVFIWELDKREFAWDYRVNSYVSLSFHCGSDSDSDGDSDSLCL